MTLCDAYKGYKSQSFQLKAYLCCELLSIQRGSLYRIENSKKILSIQVSIVGQPFGCSSYKGYSKIQYITPHVGISTRTIHQTQVCAHATLSDCHSMIDWEFLKSFFISRAFIKHMWFPFQYQYKRFALLYPGTISSMNNCLQRTARCTATSSY